MVADAGRAGGLGDLAVTPRPLAAYRDMFLLTDAELGAGPILDCPAGASPFGAQARALGGEVTGVDPAYHRPVRELVERARADVRRVVAWQRANAAGFDWSYLGSPDAVERLWEDAVDEFAADFAVDGSGTSRPRCPTCRSRTVTSRSRSAASCCSPTPICSTPTPTWPRCWSCPG
jgi:hypothetical protein